MVSFAGDAIICWFEADDGRRAATCALAMQQAMEPPAAVEQHPLTIKVAVCRGPARRLMLGDPQLQLIEVLAGPTIDALAAAGNAAQRGEVVLDAATAGLPGLLVQAWRQAGPECRIAVLTGLATPAEPCPWPQPPEPVEADLLRPWILPAVYERLRDQAGQFLAELRPVTALMLNFGEQRLEDDGQVVAELNAFVTWVQHVVARHGGALLDVTMGDHGNFLCAAFGAPLADDVASVRAVAAALELRAPPAELSGWRAPRIGLASGQMCCGPYGATERRTYGVIGDKTNLAARLMDVAAPGEVVCDEAAYVQARQRWAFIAAAPVRVKGKAAPIAIYQPSGGPAHGDLITPDTMLIGRRDELRLFAEQLAAIDAGAGRVLVIEGEASMGKTRLGDELLRQSRARSVVSAQSSAAGGQSPYGPWRTLILACVGHDLAAEPDDAAGWAARLSGAAASLAPAQRERLTLLDDLLRLGLPDTPYTRALDGTERRERLAASSRARSFSKAPRARRSAPTQKAWPSRKPRATRPAPPWSVLSSATWPGAAGRTPRRYVTWSAASPWRAAPATARRRRGPSTSSARSIRPSATRRGRSSVTRRRSPRASGPGGAAGASMARHMFARSRDDRPRTTDDRRALSPRP